MNKLFIPLLVLIASFTRPLYAQGVIGDLEEDAEKVIKEVGEGIENEVEKLVDKAVTRPVHDAIADIEDASWYFSAAIAHSADAVTSFVNNPRPYFGNENGDVPLNGDGKLAHGHAFSLGKLIGPIRIEGEYLYVPFNIDSVEPRVIDTPIGRIVSRTLMANVYYDFRRGKKWIPYVGAGAGMSYFTSDRVGIPQAGNALVGDFIDIEGNVLFTTQLTAGLGFQLTKNARLHTGYKWLKHHSGGGVIGQNYRLGSTSQHAIVTGVTFKLD